MNGFRYDANGSSTGAGEGTSSTAGTALRQRKLKSFRKKSRTATLKARIISAITFR